MNCDTFKQNKVTKLMKSRKDLKILVLSFKWYSQNQLKEDTTKIQGCGIFLLLCWKSNATHF